MFSLLNWLFGRSSQTSTPASKSELVYKSIQIHEQKERIKELTPDEFVRIMAKLKEYRIPSIEQIPHTFAGWQKLVDKKFDLQNAIDQNAKIFKIMEQLISSKSGDPWTLQLKQFAFLCSVEIQFAIIKNGYTNPKVYKSGREVDLRNRRIPKRQFKTEFCSFLEAYQTTTYAGIEAAFCFGELNHDTWLQIQKLACLTAMKVLESASHLKESYIPDLSFVVDKLLTHLHLFVKKEGWREFYEPIVNHLKPFVLTREVRLKHKEILKSLELWFDLNACFTSDILSNLKLATKRVLLENMNDDLLDCLEQLKVSVSSVNLQRMIISFSAIVNQLDESISGMVIKDLFFILNSYYKGKLKSASAEVLKVSITFCFGLLSNNGKENDSVVYLFKKFQKSIDSITEFGRDLLKEFKFLQTISTVYLNFLQLILKEPKSGEQKDIFDRRFAGFMAFSLSLFRGDLSDVLLEKYFLDIRQKLSELGVKDCMGELCAKFYALPDHVPKDLQLMIIAEYPFLVRAVDPEKINDKSCKLVSVGSTSSKKTEKQNIQQTTASKPGVSSSYIKRRSTPKAKELQPAPVSPEITFSSIPKSPSVIPVSQSPLLSEHELNSHLQFFSTKPTANVRIEEVQLPAVVLPEELRKSKNLEIIPSDEANLTVESFKKQKLFEALCLMQEDKHKDAIKCFLLAFGIHKKLREKDDLPIKKDEFSLWFSFAVSLKADLQYKEALLVLGAISAKFPENLTILNSMKVQILMILGKYQKALNLISKIESKLLTVEDILNKVKCLIITDRHEAALPILESNLTTENQQLKTELLALKGVCLTKKGLYSEALPLLEEYFQGEEALENSLAEEALKQCHEHVPANVSPSPVIAAEPVCQLSVVPMVAYLPYTYTFFVPIIYNAEDPFYRCTDRSGCAAQLESSGNFQLNTMYGIRNTIDLWGGINESLDLKEWLISRIMDLKRQNAAEYTISITRLFVAVAAIIKANTGVAPDPLSALLQNDILAGREIPIHDPKRLTTMIYLFCSFDLSRKIQNQSLVATSPYLACR